MEAKKERIESLLQAANSLKNVIYWLEKADKHFEVAEVYALMEKITGEVSALSGEVKNEMCNH